MNELVDDFEGNVIDIEHYRKLRKKSGGRSEKCHLCGKNYFAMSRYTRFCKKCENWINLRFVQNGFPGLFGDDQI